MPRWRCHAAVTERGGLGTHHGLPQLCELIRIILLQSHHFGDQARHRDRRVAPGSTPDRADRQLASPACSAAATARAWDQTIGLTMLKRPEEHSGGSADSTYSCSLLHFSRIVTAARPTLLLGQ